MSPPLFQVSVRCSSRIETEVADLLEAVFGCAPIIESKPDSDNVRVSVYLAHRPALKELSGLASVTVRSIAPQDWAESWKHHFRAIDIGSALLLKPSWSKRRPRKGQAVVVIDPGLSFGTGQHHTTRFCLAQLVALRRPGASLLDVGTGSGILAISARKVGYDRVLAIDNDAEAVRIARANARRNRVQLEIKLADLGRWKCPRKFQVICANLTADILISQRRRLVSFLEPDGALVLAGILRREFADVRTQFQKIGLKLVRSAQDSTWKSAVLSRARKTLAARALIGHS